MAITNADLDVSPVVLSPMVLTDTTENLLTNIIANISANKDVAEGLNSETETKYNEVIGAVNAIKAGSEVDISTLTETVKDIINLQVGEEGSETFLEAFRVLEAELDRRKTTYAFRHTVTASPAGKFTVDVSAYGFASSADYSIIVKVPTQVDGQSISGTCRVVSATEAEVTLRDEDVFQGQGIPTSFYDASVEGELTVVLMVVGTSNPVGLTIDVSAFRQQANMSAKVTGWGAWYQNGNDLAVEVSNPDSLPLIARLLDANYDEVAVLTQSQGLNDIAFTKAMVSSELVATKYVELTHAVDGTVDLWELTPYSEIADFTIQANINDAGRVVGIAQKVIDSASVVPTVITEHETMTYSEEIGKYHDVAPQALTDWYGHESTYDISNVDSFDMRVRTVDLSKSNTLGKLVIEVLDPATSQFIEKAVVGDFYAANNVLRIFTYNDNTLGVVTYTESDIKSGDGILSFSGLGDFSQIRISNKRYDNYPIHTFGYEFVGSEASELVVEPALVLPSISDIYYVAKGEYSTMIVPVTLDSNPPAGTSIVIKSDGTVVSTQSDLDTDTNYFVTRIGLSRSLMVNGLPNLTVETSNDNGESSTPVSSGLISGIVGGFQTVGALYMLPTYIVDDEYASLDEISNITLDDVVLQRGSITFSTGSAYVTGQLLNRNVTGDLENTNVFYEAAQARLAGGHTDLSLVISVIDYDTGRFGSATVTIDLQQTA